MQCKAANAMFLSPPPPVNKKKNKKNYISSFSFICSLFIGKKCLQNISNIKRFLLLRAYFLLLWTALMALTYCTWAERWCLMTLQSTCSWRLDQPTVKNQFKRNKLVAESLSTFRLLLLLLTWLQRSALLPGIQICTLNFMWIRSIFIIADRSNPAASQTAWLFGLKPLWERHGFMIQCRTHASWQTFGE